MSDYVALFGMQLFTLCACVCVYVCVHIKEEIILHNVKHRDVLI